ncbi:unnamed protein product, partial [Closterium sp. NIES-53]
AIAPYPTPYIFALFTCSFISQGTIYFSFHLTRSLFCSLSLSAPPSDQRATLIPVIGMILQFSPDELKQCRGSS